VEDQYKIIRDLSNGTTAMTLSDREALWHSLPNFIHKHNLIHPANIHTLTLNPHPIRNPNRKP